MALAVLVLGAVTTQFISYYYNSLNVEPQKNGEIGCNVELHLLAQQYRGSVLISESYHAMSLMNVGGKDWIADKLFNSGGTNVTKYAMYIGVSNDSSSVDTAWTYIPNEITDGGLERALASFTDTGTGIFNLTKSFSVTATRSTKLYGLYYDTYANAAQSTLVAAEQQGTGSQKNLVNGDTLVVTIQGTIS